VICRERKPRKIRGVTIGIFGAASRLISSIFEDYAAIASLTRARQRRYAKFLYSFFTRSTITIMVP
jgi:hypothetical protein